MGLYELKLNHCVRGLCVGGECYTYLLRYSITFPNDDLADFFFWFWIIRSSLVGGGNDQFS